MVAKPATINLEALSSTSILETQIDFQPKAKIQYTPWIILKMYAQSLTLDSKKISLQNNTLISVAFRGRPRNVCSNNNYDE